MISLYEISNNDFEINCLTFNELKQKYLKQLMEIDDLPKPSKTELNNSEYYIIKRRTEKRFDGILILDLHPPDIYKNVLGGLDRIKQMGHDIEIIFFYVYDKYRGEGLGRQLFKYVLSKYSNKYIGLGTGNQSSMIAKHIYHLFGFTPVIEYKDFQWWLKKPSIQG